MLPQGGVQSFLRSHYPISGARTGTDILYLELGLLERSLSGFSPLIRFDHLARTFRGTACVADVYISV